MTKKEAIKVIDGRFEIMDYCESAKLEEALDIAIKALEQPERKKGKWTIKTGELAIWDVCSECKKMVMHKAPFYNYCPNCGAEMER